jgi:hypothetical protein
VLQQAGVLPRDLGRYSTEGFVHDASMLRRQLGHGFSWDTLEGEVQAQTVVQRFTADATKNGTACDNHHKRGMIALQS